MKLWFTRFISMLFVASMVATPHMTMLAADGVPATPEQAQPNPTDKDEGTNPDSNDDASDGSANTGEDDAGTGEESSDSPDTGDPEDAGSDSGVDEGNGSSEDEEPRDGRDEDGRPDDSDNGDADESTKPDFDDSGDVKEDDASGDGSESQPGEDAEGGEKLDEDAGTTEDEDSDEDRSEAGSTPGPLGRSSIAPANFNAKSVPLPVFDAATETLTVNITLHEGFTAAANDSFLVEYDTWDMSVDDSSSPVPVTGIDGLVADVDQGAGEITFIFQGEIESLQEELSGFVSFATTVDFEACEPSIDPYTPSTLIYFETPTTSGELLVDGPECPATTEPLVTDVYYDHELGELWIDAWFAAPPVAGQQLTLTYEHDKIAIEPGPFEVLAFATASGEVFNVGTANASDGLITIDFFDANIPSDLESEFLVTVLLTGWLQGGTCATSGEPEYHPGGELEFVSNTGDAFTESFPPFVCNLEGPSIVGEWDTDELGQPVIHWTIDTGDLVLFAGVDSFDYMDSEPFVYDCDSLTIANVSGVYTETDRYCSDSGFYFDLEPQSEEPFRATINVTTALDFDPEFPPLSVVNCVEVWMFDDFEETNPELISTQASNGWGGEACYEMFLDQEQGGDVLTKSVDKVEALPGETLTYTVEVSTSTDLWNVIDLNDTLPEGFDIDPDSISCAVAPEMYQVDPCYVLSDSTLRVQVRELTPNPEQPWNRQTDPVTITLTYQGEVTGEPGSTVVNEACSVRSYVGPVGGVEPGMAAMQVEGDQSIVGGGRICDTASTLVLQPDVDEPTETPTATPTETATPSTPTPSPTATSEPEEKLTTIRVEMWDGSSIEGASWSLYAPVASQVMAEPYLTGELDSNNTTVLTDLPAGDYRFVVGPEGLDSQEFDITVTDESETIVVQYTQSVTPGAPTTPGADPDAESEDAGAVTGLPSTGQGSNSAGTALIIAAIAASVLITTAFGIRIRSPRA